MVVTEGEVVGLLGPNGSGKTTLLRLILGFLNPTAGTAQVQGQDCYRDRVQVHRLISYLPGDARLFRTMRARQVVKFFAEIRDDMDFEIAEVTDNESLKESIKMVSELLNQAKTQITLSIKEPVTLKDNEKEYMDDTYGSDEAERRKTEAFKRMNDKRGKLGNIE